MGSIFSCDSILELCLGVFNFSVHELIYLLAEVQNLISNTGYLL